MINLSGIKGKVYTETIADGQNGETIYIHPIGNRTGYAGCTVITSGNTGKFECSTSPLSAHEAGTETWCMDWPSGDVTTTTTDSVGDVTAIRGVSVSGEISIEVVI